MNFFSATEQSLHEELEQVRRQKRALELKADSVNAAERTGRFGFHRVSLEHCSCDYFYHRRKPCSHMYRLAHELGIFKLDAEKIDTELAAAQELERIRRKFAEHPYGCEISFCKTVPKNFVVIDFEAANRQPDSVCQLGLVVVKNNVVTTRKRFWIRPPYNKFSSAAEKIHGISFDDVKNKPTFRAVWPKIKNFIEGQTVAAYNLFADVTYLFATLKRYKFPRPQFEAFDILENVRAVKNSDSRLSELDHLQLETVAKKIGLAHNAHDALSDALVTAQIQIYLSKKFPVEEPTFYFSTVAAAVDSLSKNKIPLKVAVDYCNELVTFAKVLSFEKYKEIFALLELEAARCESVALYELCGRFYERCGHIRRAKKNYMQAAAHKSQLSEVKQ